jgi:hypothetical protein
MGEELMVDQHLWPAGAMLTTKDDVLWRGREQPEAT